MLEYSISFAKSASCSRHVHNRVMPLDMNSQPIFGEKGSVAERESAFMRIEALAVFEIPVAGQRAGALIQKSAVGTGIQIFSEGTNVHDFFVKLEKVAAGKF